MRVQMTTAITGTRDGADWPPVGGEVDLPDDEARGMIDAGMCVEVAAPAVAPEKAAVPAPRSKRPAAETR